MMIYRGLGLAAVASAMLGFPYRTADRLVLGDIGHRRPKRKKRPEVQKRRAANKAARKARRRA